MLDADHVAVLEQCQMALVPNESVARYVLGSVRTTFVQPSLVDTQWFFPHKPSHAAEIACLGPGRWSMVLGPLAQVSGRYICGL